MVVEMAEMMATLRSCMLVRRETIRKWVLEVWCMLV